MLPVIGKCRSRFPDQKILLTATSSTGLEKAAGSADYLRLLPFDHPLWLQKALRRVRPRIFIFGETELWPNLLDRLAEGKIPMLLVNGRLSEFSQRYYKLLRPLYQKCLEKLTAIFALNDKYRLRFLELGVEPDRVKVTGNAKYDSRPSVQAQSDAALLKARFFSDNAPVIVLGSFRPGEETFWFPVLSAGFKAGAVLNVVVAPRHNEKVRYFAERLQLAGLEFELWSALKSRGAPGAARIVLLDTMGELEPSYSFANLAFVGGTLVEGIGGHNPLEAAAYGVPLAAGPHCENIDDVVAALSAAGAMLFIEQPEDVNKLIERVCAADEDLRRAGARARAVWDRHTGAGEVIVNQIAALL